MQKEIEEEFANLMCHFGTSNRGGTRKPPFVFTEQGVAMLSLEPPLVKEKRVVGFRVEKDA